MNILQSICAEGFYMVLYHCLEAPRVSKSRGRSTCICTLVTNNSNLGYLYHKTYLRTCVVQNRPGTNIHMLLWQAWLKISTFPTVDEKKSPLPARMYKRPYKIYNWNKLPTSTGGCRINPPSTVGSIGKARYRNRSEWCHDDSWSASCILAGEKQPGGFVTCGNTGGSCPTLTRKKKKNRPQ